MCTLDRYTDELLVNKCVNHMRSRQVAAIYRAVNLIYAKLYGRQKRVCSQSGGARVGSVVMRRAIDLRFVVRALLMAVQWFTDCGLILGMCHPSSFHPQPTPTAVPPI